LSALPGSRNEFLRSGHSVVAQEGDDPGKSQKATDRWHPAKENPMCAFLNNLRSRRTAETFTGTRRRSVRKPAQPRQLELENLEERMVLSPISDKWWSLGGPNGFLGQPTTPEYVAPDGVGHYEDFQGGMILWSPADGAHEVHGAILGDYTNLGAEMGYLGYPQTDETTTGKGDGRFNRFDGGFIFWSPASGAHALDLHTIFKYASMGYEESVLGYPTSDATPILGRANRFSPILPVAYYNTFQNGEIVWTASNNQAFEVQGAIWGEYLQTANETDAGGTRVQDILGQPTSDEMNVPGVTGARMSTFQGGTIYWSPSTGAHVVYGAIGAEYAATANETDAYGTVVQSILGLPTGDEQNMPGMPGARMTTFQGGTIYWSPNSNGAHAAYGATGAEYAATANETDAFGTVVQSILGLPTGDEQNMPGMPGARVVPCQGGTIYWSPSSNGAHALYGAIGAEYAATVNETDFNGNVVQQVLGVPTGDEQNVPGVAGDRMLTLQNGTIYWSPSSNGAHAIFGGIRDTWAANGGAQGPLGLPTSDEVAATAGGFPGRFSTFQNGSILWSPNATQQLVDVYPAAAGSYIPTAGTLWGSNGPSYLDVQQGAVGDCWLISSLAEVAAREATTIQDMFVPYGSATVNGSTVSVYGVLLFDTNGFAHFVTVDTELPNAGGTYDHPVNGNLWVALAEKAYAQANGAGFVTTSSVDTNSYAALNNGTPSWALQAITGYSASDFDIDPNDAVSAWNAGELVVLNTNSPSSSFIVPSHSYAMVDYNAASNEPFELMNPWGTDANGWAPGNVNTIYGLFTANAAFVSDNFVSQSIGTGAAASGMAADMQESHATTQKENLAHTSGTGTSVAGNNLALLSALPKHTDTLDTLFADLPDSRGGHGLETPVGGVTNGGDLKHALQLAAAMHRVQGENRLTAHAGVADSDLHFSSWTVDSDEPFTLA
jgi:uncharacterized protein with LGFP repeats